MAYERRKGHPSAPANGPRTFEPSWPALPCPRFCAIVLVSKAANRTSTRPTPTGNGGHRLKSPSCMGRRKPPGSRARNGRCDSIRIGSSMGAPLAPLSADHERRRCARPSASPAGTWVEPRSVDLSPQGAGSLFVAVLGCLPSVISGGPLVSASTWMMADGPQPTAGRHSPNREEPHHG